MRKKVFIGWLLILSIATNVKAQTLSESSLFSSYKENTPVSAQGEQLKCANTFLENFQLLFNVFNEAKTDAVKKVSTVNFSGKTDEIKTAKNKYEIAKSKFDVYTYHISRSLKEDCGFWKRRLDKKNPEQLYEGKFEGAYSALNDLIQSQDTKSEKQYKTQQEDKILQYWREMISAFCCLNLDTKAKFAKEFATLQWENWTALK